MNPKLLVILGPTASGKKKLALEAAERFGGEIVSADSRKVYRHLDIGTAKPSPGDMRRVPHHLIDVITPDETFSAGEWVRRASAAVKEIISRGGLPVISGGTGFYVKAFLEGLSAGVTPDPEVRGRLEEELRRVGLRGMYRKLVSVDPGRASELHENDRFRIMRALEIFHSTGRTFTELKKAEKMTGGEYDSFIIGMLVPRKLLYARIDERVDDMVSRGLVEELERVLSMGYSRDVPGLDTVGYKEWFPWLDGSASFDECLENVKTNTRRYAKRQLTWFRAQPDIRWMYPAEVGGSPGILERVERWLESR